MRVLFVGGTGEISFACVEEATRAGHKVTIFNRGQTVDVGRLGVEQLIGDFTDDDSYAALAALDFDVVCQFLAFDWQAVERDIRTFSGRCRQYIFISTASAYQKPLASPVIVEGTPLDNPFWAYSRSKADCESRLLEAHGSGDLPVTIVRPSHTYRTRLPSVVIPGDHLAWRLLQGKPVIAPGDGESVWTVTHSEDFASAFVQLFCQADAIGDSFHIADSVGHTWNRILKTVAHQVGVDADICNVLTMSIVGYRKDWEGPLRGDKSNTTIFNTRKIEQIAKGWRCEISLEEGVARTWIFAAERLRNGYQPDWQLDALIDRIVEDHR